MDKIYLWTLSHMVTERIGDALCSSVMRMRKEYEHGE